MSIWLADKIDKPPPKPRLLQAASCGNAIVPPLRRKSATCATDSNSCCRASVVPDPRTSSELPANAGSEVFGVAKRVAKKSMKM